MAHVKFHHSLSRAHKVLKAVNTIGIPKLASRQFDASSWDGCREQGLVLKAHLFDFRREKGKALRKVAIFIAEARSSDQTLVIIDDNNDSFDNKPSEEAWEGARIRYFDPDDIKGAAKYVVHGIESLLASYHHEEK